MLHIRPIVALAVLPAVAAAGPDKSSYSLADPTPRELMRDLSTDRPDTTESPYTVDAGHIQVELSFFERSRDDEDPRTDTLSIAPTNLKIGLLNFLDLQLVLAPYEQAWVTGEDDPAGFGDTEIRLKWNLWGNDGGDTAFAAMPFVKLPTGDEALSNGDIEGGLILPLAIALPEEFSLGLMAEIDFVRDAADEGYDTEFLHSATVGRAIAGDLGAYIEYVGVVSDARESAYRATFNVGLTLGIGADVQLDAGVGLGLTDEAEDLAVFAGISVRY